LRRWGMARVARREEVLKEERRRNGRPVSSVVKLWAFSPRLARKGRDF